MNNVLQTMSHFSAAEDFFRYLDAPFKQAVINVNRLHILKRFNQYLTKYPATDDGEREIRLHYRHLLEKAYLDFITSTPNAEKLFKVFQDASGTHTVSVQRMRDAIAERQHA